MLLQPNKTPAVFFNDLDSLFASDGWTESETLGSDSSFV